VLSRPYILASDNQLPSITVGNQVPFITNTRITDNGQTINTIQYQDVGIILNVTPHINPDGVVIMDVIPEVSQLTGTTVPISDQVSAPVIAKRSAESRVGVRTGQTIVIGGLMEDRKTSTVNKIPLLGDLPIVGRHLRPDDRDQEQDRAAVLPDPARGPAAGAAAGRGRAGEGRAGRSRPRRSSRASSTSTWTGCGGARCRRASRRT
jgi:general secretion pathway protein D